MKTLVRICLSIVTLAALLMAIPTSPAYAAVGATIFVNSLADNTTHGNGLCTLREAIANANGDNDSSSSDCLAGYGSR